MREVAGLCSEKKEGERMVMNFTPGEYVKDLQQTFCSEERRVLWGGVIDKWCGGMAWEEMQEWMRDTIRENALCCSFVATAQHAW